MPVTVEDKLELFKKVLFEHIEKDWDMKRNELVGNMEKKTNEDKKNNKRQIRKIREEMENKALFKKKTMVGKIQSEADEEISKIREKLLQDLHKSLRDWCSGFIESDKYKEYLKKNLGKTLELIKGQNISISLTKKDINLYSAFIGKEINKFNRQIVLDFAESKEDIIGGFVITDNDFGMAFDLSIKSLLDDGKGYASQLLCKELDGVLS